MRKYRIRVMIENTDNGPAEYSEVALGYYNAPNINEIVKILELKADTLLEPPHASADRK